MWTETAGRTRVLTARVPVACARCGAEIKVTMIRRNMTNYCKACQRQRHAAKNLADYHARRKAGMSAAEWKRPKKAGQPAAVGTIVVLYDPCDAPLAAGMTISWEEYSKGLRLGAFEPGTVFRMPAGHVEVAGWER